jgi:hypothetical protein
MKALRIILIALLSIVLSVPVFAKSSHADNQAHRTATVPTPPRSLTLREAMTVSMKAVTDHRIRAATTRTARRAITIGTGSTNSITE